MPAKARACNRTNKRMIQIVCTVLAVVLLSCQGTLALAQTTGSYPLLVGTAGSAISDIPYLKRFHGFQTKLHRKGPAPLTPKAFETPEGWVQVTYPSTDGLKLKAWLHVPASRGIEPPPGMVYFHGNFALHGYDFAKCKPFTDAGFVVLLPTLRGENHNPGHCEMFLSEVKDAMNAVRWLHSQRIVDSKRIYTFGHSAGGVISALLSLHEGLPVRLGGSSGGLYDVELFDAIRSRVPFDLGNPVERQLRVLPGNTQWMKRRHVAYVGQEDLPLHNAVKRVREQLRPQKDPKLELIVHPGNHNTALPDAMQRFLKHIEASS